MKIDSLTLRPALVDDARGIHDSHRRSILEICAKDYSEAQLEGWGRRPYDEEHRKNFIQKNFVWVLASGAEILGHSSLRTVKKTNALEGHVDTLYIVPEVLGQGWGKKLLHLIEEKARELGISRMSLSSTLTSEKFYLSQGYRPTLGRPYHQTQTGLKIDCIPMEKWLKNAPPFLRLERPEEKFRESFLQGLSEMTTPSERFSWVYEPLKKWDPEKDFPAYVSELRKRAELPPEPLVPDDVYWAISGSEMVGRISLRHRLNDFLARIGGNIGYIVKPSWRGKGIASEMLRQILLSAKAEEIGKVLITCDESNEASRRTIVRNGGVCTGFVFEDPEGKGEKTLHHWIDLSAP
jgi:predicted acetyltransferase